MRLRKVNFLNPNVVSGWGFQGFGIVSGQEEDEELPLIIRTVINRCGVHVQFNSNLESIISMCFLSIPYY